MTSNLIVIQPFHDTGKICIPDVITASGKLFTFALFLSAVFPGNTCQEEK